MVDQNLLEVRDVEIKKKTLVKKAITEKRYMPLERGRKTLETFLKRHQEYLKLYDLYCAVDLTTGEFAFTKYFEFNDDDFKAYLADERWEDMRVAVAEFKKLDPVEIVFMSFLSENRIDTDSPSWEADLTGSVVWDEILRICNSNLSSTELGYKDDKGTVSSEEVMKDIIKQGTQLMFDLHKQEEARNVQIAAEAAAQTEVQATEVVEETVVEQVIVEPYPITYYDPYWDPYYISPIWLVPLLIF